MRLRRRDIHAELNVTKAILAAERAFARDQISDLADELVKLRKRGEAWRRAHVRALEGWDKAELRAIKVEQEWARTGPEVQRIRRFWMDRCDRLNDEVEDLLAQMKAAGVKPHWPVQSPDPNELSAA